MILLLLPISLLGLLLFTSIFYATAGIAVPFHLELRSNWPSSPVVRYQFTERSSHHYISSSSIDLPSSPSRKVPLRVKLHWDDISGIDSRDSIELSKGSMTPPKKRFSVQLLPSDVKGHSYAPSTDPKQTSPKSSSDKIDPVNFLVALAAQERRVLELNEELQKAQTELTRLKRQWAHHEAIRKRQEIRQQAEPLRPIKISNEETPMAHQSNNLGAQSKRRPAVLKTKQTHRKVFAGGRHTRTLSLLSPTSLANRGSITDFSDGIVKETGSQTVPMTAIPRITTPPSEQPTLPDSSKEAIVSTGKQIMDEIKEGLWTFIGDLKHATVGDEARTSQIHSKAAPTQSQGMPKGTAHCLLGDHAQVASIKSLPSEHVSATKESKTSAGDDGGMTKESEIVNLLTSAFDDESWDDWEFPPNRSAASTLVSPTQSTTKSSIHSIPKTQSVSLDQIPWPALQNLPGNLTRTASHLMKEWEKSLHSPVESSNEAQ